MPVLGLQFDGPYGVYHSAYDDFFWMNHFGDPGYRYHTLMSQLWGVLALRLANADLLPFDFASYANNIRQFVNELSKANGNMWGQPPSAVQPGEARQPSPLNLKPVLDAIDDFESAGQRLNASAHAALASGPIDPNSPPPSTTAPCKSNATGSTPTASPDALVQTHPLRRTLYLRPPRTPRPNRSCRKTRLAHRPTASRNPPSGADQQTQS